MNEAHRLSERIDALEARLAYQDRTIETLNETITAQWRQIYALTATINRLGDRLQDIADSVPGPPSERPPHY